MPDLRRDRDEAAFCPPVPGAFTTVLLIAGLIGLALLIFG